MSKRVKTFIPIAIVVVFMISAFIMLGPRGFADYSRSDYINATYVKLSAQAGIVQNDSDSFQFFHNDPEFQRILDIFKDYRYHLNWRTFTSSTTIEGLAQSIHLSFGDNYIIITDNSSILIDKTLYSIDYFGSAKSNAMINELKSVLGIDIKSDSGLSVRDYLFENTDEPFNARVSLQESNMFIFNYSPISSYFAHGSYEIANNNLILRTGDGENVYTFRIDGETIIFDAEKSSIIPSYAKVPNGAIFE